MTSSFYTTTWIDVELRTHCKVRGYQESNYHRSGSDDLLIGDPFTPAISPEISSFSGNNFLFRTNYYKSPAGRERGGGEERERSGGRGEPEAYGCVTIIIYNNKLLMLCSIM